MLSGNSILEMVTALGRQCFSNGQVYLAEITEISNIPDSEMSEVDLFHKYPEELTYPKILPLLFEKVKQCYCVEKPDKENNL